MLANLSAKTIAELEGGIAGNVIDAAIAKAVTDLEERGVEDEKWRVVTIEVAMKKIASDAAVIEVTANTKIPPFRTAATSAAGRFRDGKHHLQFQTMNPDNVEQNTFKEMHVEGGEVATE